MSLITFYIWVSKEERIKRMLQRGDSTQQIQEKIQIDEEKFKAAKQVADFIVENVELDKTIEKIIELSKQ